MSVLAAFKDEALSEDHRPQYVLYYPYNLKKKT